MVFASRKEMCRFFYQYFPPMRAGQVIPNKPVAQSSNEPLLHERRSVATRAREGQGTTERPAVGCIATPNLRIRAGRGSLHRLQLLVSSLLGTARIPRFRRCFTMWENLMLCKVTSFRTDL